MYALLIKENEGRRHSKADIIIRESYTRKLAAGVMLNNDMKHYSAVCCEERVVDDIVLVARRPAGRVVAYCVLILNVIHKHELEIISQ